MEKMCPHTGKNHPTPFPRRKSLIPKKKTSGLVHQICSGPTMLGAICAEDSVPQDKGEIRLEPTQIPISLVDQKEKSDKNKGTKTSRNKTGSREGILDEPIKGPVLQKVNSVEIRPVNDADTNLYKVTQGQKQGILDEPKKVYVLQNANSGGIKIVKCADTSVHIVRQGFK